MSTDSRRIWARADDSGVVGMTGVDKIDMALYSELLLQNCTIIVLQVSCVMSGMSDCLAYCSSELFRREG